MEKFGNIQVLEMYEALRLRALISREHYVLSGIPLYYLFATSILVAIEYEVHYLCQAFIIKYLLTYETCIENRSISQHIQYFRSIY